jgi:hypothetical protein
MTARNGECLKVVLEELASAGVRLAASPSLRELFSARCRHHAASSPAALACEKAVLRELYWEGAKRLLSEND